MSGPSVAVTRLGPGTYRVEYEGRNEIVYVAGSVADRWIFWEGQVFRGEWGGPDGVAGRKSDDVAGPDRVRPAYKLLPTSLTAPMPARVIRILVQPGSAVKKGDTLVVLEAMKMELPVRAPADAIVTAVHCREGDLVRADAVLMELGPSGPP